MKSNLINLSVCMIVKNEEKYLRNCLLSVKDIANEIIIVDTGSEDNTISIAKEFNADITSIKWNDNFSEARNISISKALGKWILIIDADERLEPKSQSELNQIIQSSDKAVYSVIINSRYKIFNYYDVSLANRLFLNNPELRFHNLVHEEITYSALKLGYEFRNSNIEMKHLGYSLNYELMKKKALRNLKLLLKEIKTSPNPIKYFTIAQCYGILKDYRNVIKYLKLLKTYGKNNVPVFYWNEANRILKQIYSSRKKLKPI